MSQTSELAIAQVPSPERRLHARQPVRMIVYVKLDEGNGGIALNVSERGLSVQAVAGLRDASLPAVRFQLPPSPDWIEAPARVVWASESKTVAGLEFGDLPERESNRIREWLAQEAAAEKVPARQPGGSNGAEKAPVESSSREPGRSNGAKGATKLAAPAARNGLATAAPESSPGVRLAQGLSYGRRLKPQMRSHRTPTKNQGSSPLREHVPLIVLLMLFAGISLAAGWAAGRKSIGWKLQVPSVTTARVAAVTQDPAPPLAEPVASAPDNALENTTSQQAVTSPSAPPETPVPAPRAGTRPNPFPQSIRHQLAPRRWTSPPPFHPMQATAHRQMDTLSAPIPIGVSGGAAGLVASPALVSAPKVESTAPAVSATSKQAASVLQVGPLVHRVEPVYPRLAQEQSIAGTVKLRVTVGRDGAVRKAKAFSGPSLLRPAAAEAVRQWRYEPSLLKGKPVEVDREVNVEFQLPQSSR